LVFKSGYFPRVLGVLLIFASLGYLIDSFANVLLPNYTNYEARADSLEIGISGRSALGRMPQLFEKCRIRGASLSRLVPR
jgi:hypothetical protein